MAGYQRKGVQRETPTPGAKVLVYRLQSWMRWTGEILAEASYIIR